MRDPTECAEALENLGGIFRLVQVDGEKAVVCGHVEGRHFAGAEEVGDVFHLDEGHSRLLEFNTWAGHGEVDESVYY